MTETRQMSLPRQLMLLAAVLAAFAVIWLLFVRTSGEPAEPTDPRSCAELSESFDIYSSLISKHDRSWSQWEAVEAEKWAAYDAARAKDCPGF